MKDGTGQVSCVVGLIGLYLSAFACCVHGQTPQGDATKPAAQQPPPTPNDSLVSPETSADGHVTFRLYGPDATTVKVQTEGPEAVPGATQKDVMAGYSGRR